MGAHYVQGIVILCPSWNFSGVKFYADYTIIMIIIDYL